MDPVARALWFIESHLETQFTLDDVARVACVSRFHLCRVFASVTGMAVMQYARARRLEEAAVRLAARPNEPILDTAVAYGFESHAAFTRAFCNHFGVPPRIHRFASHRYPNTRREVMAMSKEIGTKVRPTRLAERAGFTVAGISRRYTWETNDGIPAQWALFSPRIAEVPGRSGWTTYGVCSNSDDTGAFDYLCGVEIVPGTTPGREFHVVAVPAAYYAVFVHEEHVSTLKATVNSIWNHWLPDSGYRAAETPDFEVYDTRFDPDTGFGGVEVWVPIVP
ncbi:MAG: AraC family transcriptional regulator [Spirochaetaceae bacterium]|nr:MAG: AraC family transcriptional regulator [Spirochaetaceae bacterium]